MVNLKQTIFKYLIYCHSIYVFNLDFSLWFFIGLIGQIFFGGRFIVQWIYSEYKKESVIPVSFWYLSLIGSFLLLAYSIHLNDIIFTAGFSLNILIYIRNLVLRKNKHSVKKV